MNFSPDQEKAWELLLSDQNTFITGEAGSGKSYLIREFMKDKDPKKVAILASTGAAAVLVGGRTFHSFMGLGIMEGGIDATVERAIKDRRVVRRLKQIETLIIDEVSMLSGETLQTAELICQMARRSIDPWGGIRIIAVGDFAQLPPINRFGEKQWAFSDPVWERSNFQTAVLKQNMRSGNKDFLNILNEIRRGKVSEKVSHFLNEKKSVIEDSFEGTRLFPRRDQTEAFNINELQKLDGEIKVFPTIYTGNERYIEQLKKHSPISDEIQIKNNALIMLRQNDPKQRWVNGSTGHIRDITENTLTVELLNGRFVKVEPSSFSLLNAEAEVVASASNFPISLAYATTIHKAQGMTLDKLMVNLKSLWEPGQAYVALSRITNPDNLRVEDWQIQSIKADPAVERFYQKFSN